MEGGMVQNHHVQVGHLVRLRPVRLFIFLVFLKQLIYVAE